MFCSNIADARTYKVTINVVYTAHPGSGCWVVGNGCARSLTISYYPNLREIQPYFEANNIHFPEGSDLMLMEGDFGGKTFFEPNDFSSDTNKEGASVSIPAQKAVYCSELGGYLVYGSFQ